MGRDDDGGKHCPKSIQCMGDFLGLMTLDDWLLVKLLFFGSSRFADSINSYHGTQMVF
jgi:hypothetical protein